MCLSSIPALLYMLLSVIGETDSKLIQTLVVALIRNRSLACVPV